MKMLESTLYENHMTCPNPHRDQKRAFPGLHKTLVILAPVDAVVIFLHPLVKAENFLLLFAVVENSLHPSVAIVISPQFVGCATPPPIASVNFLAPSRTFITSSSLTRSIPIFDHSITLHTVD